MKHLLTILFIFCSLFSIGQNPLVKMWDKRFGGNDLEVFSHALKTSDGGYILGGSANSGISGDKTQLSWGSYDYWVAKIDASGNKEWDRDFGGTDEDVLKDLKQTSDGGYILGGLSYSGISGDKTENTWSFSYDYWVIKIDSLGNKQWDKDIGGEADDWLFSIQQTRDGGYILGGESTSGIGGNKTQPVHGFGDIDYWIIKLDPSGNILWDKDFGGNNDDLMYSLLQTNDGGYILGGYSSSGANGDKTQPTLGMNDFWTIKTDSLGNKIWDKDFGGSNDDILNSIIQTSDQGFLLGGYSLSGISGNKTEALIGGSDFWIVKIDAFGNKQWDRDFGGSSDEEAIMFAQCTDGGYLISGDSYSSISGNKTESNLGPEQTWVLKIDSLGIIEWDKTIFTMGHDENGQAIQVSNECYIISNSSDGSAGGYKTQNAWNNSLDFWVIMLCDTSFSSNFIAPRFICPGSCIEFLNLSINSNSFIWFFPGASPNTSTDINPTNICYPTPGSYDVQLIATNANGSDTLLLTNYITVYPSPPPQSITQSGDTLFAVAGSASYQWYFNTNLINGATDYFYVANASGDYNVVATDANGCEVEAAVFNVLADLPSTVDRGLWTIFPNPVEDKLIIHKAHPDSYRDTSETAAEISIYNVIGEKVFMAVDYLLPTVDCRLFAPGLYYIEITSCGKTFRSKFVKQ